ncbi:glutamate--cysteine ligase [Nitrincola sp. MINF-07-Sa-05]|uniref:glutamate--cysteine ligase n=1 Tax=Nitrincola salilacus TaxID=3400273 RepID=UPI0039180B50
MSVTLEHHLNQLVKHGHSGLLTQLQHGIEKEGLRVDRQGRLAQTPHPRSLGSTLTHSQITTDYSEALLEFITPVFQRPDLMLQHLEDLHRFSYAKLDQELIWCASMPCNIFSEEEIPIAEYGNSNIGRLKHIYRVGLQHRYGKMMQTIAGIHYNFSLPEQLWPAWQDISGNRDSMTSFRSASYFTLIRNFRRYSWLLLYLFGASPALSSSFLQGRPHQLDTLNEDTLYLPWATSLRMSDLGYSNRAQSALNICFNQLGSYTESLQQAIQTPHPQYERLGVKVNGNYQQLNSNILQIENEYYSDIRPKRVAESGEKPIHALRERGIQYVEVRNTDINPLLPVGISLEQAHFMDAFLVTCLYCNDAIISDAECALLSENHNRIVNRGREPGLTLLSDEGEIAREALGAKILQQVDMTAQLLDQASGTQHYRQAVAAQQTKLENSSMTPSSQVLASLQASGASHHEWTLALSKQHKDEIMATRLAPELLQQMTCEANASLLEQSSIEDNDTMDFDTFLAQFNAQ